MTHDHNLLRSRRQRFTDRIISLSSRLVLYLYNDGLGCQRLILIALKCDLTPLSFFSPPNNLSTKPTQQNCQADALHLFPFYRQAHNVEPPLRHHDGAPYWARQ